MRCLAFVTILFVLAGLADLAWIGELGGPGGLGSRGGLEGRGVQGPAAEVAADDGAGDVPTVLLSRQVLAVRGLSVGDVVLLSGDPSGGEPTTFRIAGSYEPMPDPIRLTSGRLEARFHLPDLLALTADPADLLAPDTVNSINVKLVDPDTADSFARELSGRLPLLRARASRGEGDGGNPFVVLERFHLAIAIVTVATSAVFLLALMVMLADERRETIRILRWIGLTRRRVLWQMLLEGGLIALAGAAFGVLLAAASQGGFNAYFQWRYDTSLVFVRITPSVVWRSVVLAVPLGVLASLATSWTLIRRDTVRR